MAKKNIVVLSAQELLERVKAGIPFRHVREEDIDYSDIPELTEEQMRQFKPFHKKSKKKLAR